LQGGFPSHPSTDSTFHVDTYAEDSVLPEDCLSLNIWTPVNATNSSKLPVMFWLHGGFFMYESSIGAYNSYNGGKLAAQGNVVVVSANYRLDVLGWMVSTNGSAGNLGLLDQRLAMIWVQQNIAAFGGDPNSVTLFGESAGAVSALAHMSSSRSAGLFHRVIMQSNPAGVPFFPKQLAARLGDQVAALVGCSPAGGIACLQAVPLSALMNASATILQASGASALWYPVVDSKGEVPQQPLQLAAKGKLHKVDLLFGFNTDEQAYFLDANSAVRSDPITVLKELGAYEFGEKQATDIITLYSRMSHLHNAPLLEIVDAALTDCLFRCAPQAVAASVQRAHGKTWSYRFDAHQLANSFWAPLGLPQCVKKVCHGAELPFVFGFQGLPGTLALPRRNALSSVPSPFANVTFTGEELRLSQLMQTYWTNFALTGDPNHGAADLAKRALWPIFNGTTRNTLILRPRSMSTEDKRVGSCDFWEKSGTFLNFKLPPM
jgi:carboxylesterase type B